MLYIIRHGQTDWNARHCLQGQTDIPLNSVGREMAEEAALRYHDIPLDICFSSPLVRASETARIVLGGRQVPILYDDRLKEISFGSHEGTESVFSKPLHPLYAFFKDPANYQASGGAECFSDLYDRTGAFLEERVIPLLRENRNVLIAGHGAMNLSIINRILDIPLSDFWRMQMKNCEMHAIDTASYLERFRS